VRTVQLGARAVAVLFGFALTGCGADAPVASPILQLPFSSSSANPVLFNSVQGVQVGTVGQFAFGALSSGTVDLVVQSVSYIGDASMTLLPPAVPLPATLSFNQELIVSLSCTPAAVQPYAGNVTIVSNAVNDSSAVVFLNCVGMP
jgi:hypothetical protein